MKSTEIIEAIRQKLTVPGGRHLYGVLGTYAQLDGFARKLTQAKTTDGAPFPKPVNVNRGILDAIPDEERGWRELPVPAMSMVVFRHEDLMEFGYLTLKVG